MSVLRHLHRPCTHIRSFGVILMHERLLCRCAGVRFSKLGGREIHSIHPGGDISAVLRVGSRVPNTNELKPPVVDLQICQSNVSVTAERTYCSRTLVLWRSRLFSKEPTRDCSVEIQYPAEGRIETVDPRPAIEPFPKTAAYGGCGSGDQETTASKSVDLTRFNVQEWLVHWSPPRSWPTR